MPTSPSLPRPLSFTFPAMLHPGRVLAAALLLGAAGTLSAAPIVIPNGSFESPVVDPQNFVEVFFPPWTKTANPYPPQVISEQDWIGLTGIFPNTPPSSYNTITNIDGNQAAYLTSISGAGFFQDLATPDAVFTIGQAYEFTLGIRPGEQRQGNQVQRSLVDGDTMEIVIYYRNGNNEIVPISSRQIIYNSATMPYSTFLTDYTTATGVVGASDPWAGKSIGIMARALTFIMIGGYWDMDHARLVSVPEPAVAGSLLLGLAGLGLLRRRAGRSVPA